MVAGRPERRRDHLVRREVVQADRAISPVGEHHGQIGRETGVRTMVKLVALVDMLDQRLAGLRMGDRQSARPSARRAALAHPRARRSHAAGAP